MKESCLFFYFYVSGGLSLELLTGVFEYIT